MFVVEAKPEWRSHVRLAWAVSDSQGRESWQEALTSIDGARELLERRQLATVTRMSLPGGLGAWRVGGKSRGELPGPISSPSPAQLAEL